MRFLVQRVLSASVSVDGSTVGKIDHGFLVFVGINHEDDKEIAGKMLKKLIGLRIFKDSEDKVNLDIKTVSGSLLIISQFTLYADCRKGNRPSFTGAGDPAKANELYEFLIEEAKKEIPVVEHGIFGADMKVELVNDGPFTVLLDSKEICACQKTNA